MKSINKDVHEMIDFNEFAHIMLPRIVIIIFISRVIEILENKFKRYLTYWMRIKMVKYRSKI